MRRRRHPDHLAQLDALRHADGVHLNFGLARRLRVRDCVLFVHGRVTVGDDDGDVLGVGSVSLLQLELLFVHDPDGFGRVRVPAQVAHVSDLVLQRILVQARREAVQMEDGLGVRGEPDDADADITRLDVQVVDDTLDELQQQLPVVVRFIWWVVVANATRTVDHQNDVGPEVGALG